jgi:hypothetical protein
MEILARTISRALEKKSYCIVPYDEVKRVWPRGEDRTAKLARFASEHDWRLFSCVEGLGALIVRRDFIPPDADLAGVN